MTLAPLLASPGVIQFHAFGAIAAFAVGIVQFALPKGVRLHRVLGWVWVVIMAAVALASFDIHELRVWGSWSPIHLLSIVTLASLVLGVSYARRGRVGGHRVVMTLLFVGALVVAGGFTFMPGRIMHAVVFQ